jgi:hypothetical protein
MQPRCTPRREPGGAVGSLLADLRGVAGAVALHLKRMRKTRWAGWSVDAAALGAVGDAKAQVSPPLDASSQRAAGLQDYAGESWDRSGTGRVAAGFAIGVAGDARAAVAEAVGMRASADAVVAVSGREFGVEVEVEDVTGCGEDVVVALAVVVEVVDGSCLLRQAGSC